MIPMLLALALVIPQDDAVTLRGKAQHVRLYGPRDGTPVVVASGDGGWIHLAPHVAAMLAARGFFVLGFDSKAYLSSFTHGRVGVRPADVVDDFARLIDHATAHDGRRAVIAISAAAATIVPAARLLRIDPVRALGMR